MDGTTLTDRAVVRLSGDDVRGFLDGLVTNMVTGDLPVYAALLTPQGKVVTDFIVWSEGEDLLLDVAAEDAEALIRRLSMYRLRRAISITRDEALGVHWSRNGQGAADPRLPALGHRWLGPAGAPASGWLEHRLRHGVAEGAELTDLLWLECNAAELNGVSFTKGCFVGQENTARMNWRSKVNRRLFAISDVHAPADRVRARYPEIGLAVIHARIDAVPPDAIIPDWLAPALAPSE